MVTRLWNQRIGYIGVAHHVTIEHAEARGLSITHDTKEMTITIGAARRRAALRNSDMMRLPLATVCNYYWPYIRPDMLAVLTRTGRDVLTSFINSVARVPARAPRGLDRNTSVARFIMYPASCQIICYK